MTAERRMLLTDEEINRRGGSEYRTGQWSEGLVAGLFAARSIYEPERERLLARVAELDEMLRRSQTELVMLQARLE